MINISLDGEWQLFHLQRGAHDIRHPDDLIASGLESIPANVPGNVELDLVRAGLLPDPFYADNIKRLRSLETYEWWYQRRIDIPETFKDQACELVFDGLDTLATIWLNGEQVGQSSNMLVEQHFIITGALHPGEVNTVTVRLEPVINAALRHHYDANVMSWEHRSEGLHIRKAPHVWGWDIMPRAVSAGIWRSARIQRVPENAIEQLYYWTIDIDPQNAILGVRFQIRTSEPFSDKLTLYFHGACQGHEFNYEWPIEFPADGCRIRVEGARLWWPSGYGEPNLYTVNATLCRDGQVLVERVDHIGIRKIKIDRTELAGKAWIPEPDVHPVSRLDTPPASDSHFVIYVNHEPIMVKGTNWVPLDAFHSRDGSRLEQALAMVSDLGCNMIRCWGGNVYEDEAFFNEWDARGIMVWQDFSFACCIYPLTDDFFNNVRQEITAVAGRLRNHPSLVVWCGDNEVDLVYLSEGLDPQTNRLTREVIPQVLQRCDPHRAYLPSSPFIPPSALKREDAYQSTPEQHLWGPRGYYKSSFYTNHSAHFIGEIGYHGCPNVSSILKFISAEHLWPWQANDEWQVHSVYHWEHKAIERDRIQLMANQIKELFGTIPTDLETFALASQITQAEAVKFFLESTRSRKWQTSGILWWNLLDGWPQFSDAVVDYYFTKKLAYQYIWRVQRPVIILLGEAGAGQTLPVIVSNDSRRPSDVHYFIRDADSGEEIIQGEFTAPANQNWQVGRIHVLTGDQRLFLINWEIGGESYGNHYLSGTPPVSLERYRAWLPQIAALPHPFDAGSVAL
jgi:beta-mannosidase